MKERSLLNAIFMVLAFQTKVNKNRHLASVREVKKPFNCNTCDANFTQKSSLNGHIAPVHEGEKPLNSNTLNRILEKKIPS